MITPWMRVGTDAPPLFYHKRGERSDNSRSRGVSARNAAEEKKAGLVPKCGLETRPCFSQRGEGNAEVLAFTSPYPRLGCR